VSGDIMKLPDFRSAEGIYDLFGSQRYKTVTIRKV
jgi:NADH-quinone oxidoreductase subunit G